MATVDELRQHAELLASKHNIRLLYAAYIHDDESCSQWTKRQVWMPPITTERIYATALHEMGHMVAPGGLSRERIAMYKAGMRTYRDAPIDFMLAEERAAWQWARENALEWTEPMMENEATSMKTYTDEKLRQAKRRLYRHYVKLLGMDTK